MTVVLTEKSGKASDKSYDELFRRLDAASMFGRVNAVREGKTARGYEVVLAEVPQDVLNWIGDNAHRFEIG